MAEPSSASSRERIVGSVLHLTQALAQVEWQEAPRLWLITRGAQPVDAVPAELAIQQAPLWGLGRVIALDHPKLACVRVDLNPSDRGAGRAAAR
jgi:hypothetical protein